MPTSGASGVVAAALAAVRRRESQQGAAAVADLRILVAAVEAVLTVHHPSKLTVGGYVCGKCLDPYPCTTVRALERHLEMVDA